MNLKEKARELAEIVSKLEELEDRKKELQKELLDGGYDSTEFFSDLGKKVILAEGRSTVEHDIMKVLSSMTDKGLIAEFPKITKIIQSYVDEKVDDFDKQNQIKLILLENAKSTKGDWAVSVRKMTKEDFKKIS